MLRNPTKHLATCRGVLVVAAVNSAWTALGLHNAFPNQLDGEVIGLAVAAVASAICAAIPWSRLAFTVSLVCLCCSLAFRASQRFVGDPSWYTSISVSVYGSLAALIAFVWLRFILPNVLEARAVRRGDI